jgi:hypothetical protein
MLDNMSTVWHLPSYDFRMLNHHTGTLYERMINCLATLTAMRLPNPQYPFPNTRAILMWREQSSCRIYNLGNPRQTCSSVLEQIPIEGAHLIWTVKGKELETESPTTAKFYLRIYWSQQPCPNLATSQSSWTWRSRTLDRYLHAPT